MEINNFLKGFKTGQRNFGETIATVINSVLLSTVYFIGIGTTSLFAKIFNKHFLKLKIDESKETYWEELNLTKEETERYYRQF